jgi:hypothetical protein
MLRAGKHHSYILQAAWNKHKESAFQFSLLLVCPKELRTFYEEKLLPLASYNLVKTKLQKIFSGAKISVALTGKPKTATHRAAISAGKIGMKMGPAFCEKARLRQLGKPMAGLAKQRLSEAMKLTRAAEAETTRRRAHEVYNAYVYGGPSISKLCANVGITTTSFYTVCAVENLPSVKAAAIDKFLYTLAELRAKGHSIQTASDLLGVKSQTVRALLRKRKKVLDD